jgi:dynein light chain 4
MEVLPFNLDDFTKWKQGQAIVRETDMDDTIRQEAKDFVISGIEKASGQFGINIEHACKYVKDMMDRQFGPSWHCVMGEGFSFEVTRQAKTTLYMYYAGKIAVLLFKC